jgi:hypothetical protein
VFSSIVLALILGLLMHFDVFWVFLFCFVELGIDLKHSSTELHRWLLSSGSRLVLLHVEWVSSYPVSFFFFFFDVLGFELRDSHLVGRQSSSRAILPALFVLIILELESLAPTSLDLNPPILHRLP